MQLIVKQESVVLKDLHIEIKQVQADVVAYTHLKAFSDLDSRIKSIINKLESFIMETKQTKLMRDLQDYKRNNVYSWFKRGKTEHILLVPS